MAGGGQGASIQTLLYNIGADTSVLRQQFGLALREFQRLGAASQALQGNLRGVVAVGGGLRGSLADLSHGLSLFNRSILFLSRTVVDPAQGLLKMSDSAIQLRARLGNVSSSTDEASDSFQRLFQISQDTRAEFETTVSLYARLALGAKEVGLSQQELIRITEILNKTITVSGTATREASASLLQLSQGIAAGRFAGDELKSVFENLPAVAQGIARSLGVTTGQLREMGSQGKLTAEVVTKAILSMGASIDEQFAKFPVTGSQALTQISNEFFRMVDTINQAIGGTKGFTDFVDKIREELSDLTQELTTRLETESLGDVFVDIGARAGSDMLDAMVEYVADWFSWGLIDPSEKAGEAAAAAFARSFGVNLPRQSQSYLQQADEALDPIGRWSLKFEEFAKHHARVYADKLNDYLKQYLQEAPDIDAFNREVAQKLIELTERPPDTTFEPMVAHVRTEVDDAEVNELFKLILDFNSGMIGSGNAINLDIASWASNLAIAKDQTNLLSAEFKDIEATVKRIKDSQLSPGEKPFPPAGQGGLATSQIPQKTREDFMHEAGLSPVQIQTILDKERMADQLREASKIIEDYNGSQSSKVELRVAQNILEKELKDATKEYLAFKETAEVEPLEIQAKANMEQAAKNLDEFMAQVQNLKAEVKVGADVTEALSAVEQVKKAMDELRADKTGTFGIGEGVVVEGVSATNLELVQELARVTAEANKLAQEGNREAMFEMGKAIAAWVDQFDDGARLLGGEYLRIITAIQTLATQLQAGTYAPVGQLSVAPIGLSRPYANTMYAQNNRPAQGLTDLTPEVQQTNALLEQNVAATKEVSRTIQNANHITTTERTLRRSTGDRSYRLGGYAG